MAVGDAGCAGHSERRPETGDRRPSTRELARRFSILKRCTLAFLFVARATLLPAGLEVVTLQIRSANKWLGPELSSLRGRLIGLVSHWDDFREIGRTMLEAAGVDAELLVVRDRASRAGYPDSSRPVP